MPKCSCGKEMMSIGFTKNEDGDVDSEEYSCPDRACKSYLDLKRVPLEDHA